MKVNVMIYLLVMEKNVKTTKKTEEDCMLAYKILIFLLTKF